MTYSELKTKEEGAILNRFCMYCDGVTMNEKDGKYLCCTACNRHVEVA